MNGKPLVKTILCVLYFIAFIPLNNIAGGVDDIIKVKEVINNDSNIKNLRDYDYGKYRYADYKVKGLSESFLIKKKADVILSSEDIASVEISKMYQNKKNLNAYWVKMSFTASGAQKMKNYTSSKVNKKIAFEIRDTIFIIATLLSPINNKVSMPVTNKSIAEIKSILSKVTKNISVEE